MKVFSSRSILPFLLFLVVAFAPAWLSAEDPMLTIQETAKSAKQELDIAYRNLGAPVARDFDTMLKIQRAAKEKLFRLVFGKNGLNLSASALPGRIRINIAYLGKSVKEDWVPPES